MALSFDGMDHTRPFKRLVDRPVYGPFLEEFSHEAKLLLARSTLLRSKALRVQVPNHRYLPKSLITIPNIETLNTLESGTLDL